MRITELRALLQRIRKDGLIVTYPPHIRLVTGFTSSNALFYIDAASAIIVTDSRYAVGAKELQGLEVLIANPGEPLGAALQRKHPLTGTVAFQAEFTATSTAEEWNKVFTATIEPTTGLLDELIASKTAEEVDKIARAQAITDRVYGEILPLLQPGVTEKEIAAEIVSRQLKAGADGISPEFWPIVAFGARTALPHAHPGSTVLRRDDVVMLDFGCTVAGYCSDMTRTVAIGSASDELKAVYDVVLKAQTAGIQAAKAGARACDVDAAARSIIAEAGYADCFQHSLGHGLGLDIHEWPTINPRKDHPLPDHAVVTIEPGIYLPGKFGVRIEDILHLDPAGTKNLTASPKELTIL